MLNRKIYDFHSGDWYLEFDYEVIWNTLKFHHTLQSMYIKSAEFPGSTIKRAYFYHRPVPHEIVDCWERYNFSITVSINAYRYGKISKLENTTVGEFIDLSKS